MSLAKRIARKPVQALAHNKEEAYVIQKQVDSISRPEALQMTTLAQAAPKWQKKLASKLTLTKGSIGACHVPVTGEGQTPEVANNRSNCRT